MRTLLAGLLCLTLAAALQPSARLHAAEEHDAAHAAGDAHGGGDAHGQEGPITATKNDVDLAIWSLIVFAIFVVVLKKFAWGPITEGLDRRENNVLQDITEAENARIKAEKMLAAHAEKLDKVQDEVREILAEARREAEHIRAEMVATAQKESETLRQRAVRDIEQARDQALDDLFEHMSKTVADATEHVLGRAITGADQDRLIKESLAGLPKHG